MKKRTKSFLLLHLIVFIWGFTGILGKEISLPPFQLVWWRMLIAVAGISIFAVVSKHSLVITRKEFLRFSVVGLITAAHWICFFASIKCSNVSTALVVLSTTSFFVALLGPLLRKSRIFYSEIVLGLMVITGLVIIFKFESKYTLGIILSLLAAFLAATFSSFNSMLVQRHSSTTIAFYEMASGLIGVTLFLLFRGDINEELFIIRSYDFACLLILGLVATAFAFIAGIEVMKELSPFTCALTLNLEPVYTIIFAVMLYGESEYMSGPFYIGAAIILSTLFIEIYLKRRVLNT